jgi:tryptophan synthase alpha chain
MPYFTLGYPTLPDSEAIVSAIAHSGADLIELGLPFSDPLADGPTIQGSTQIALENGVNLRTCLQTVRRLRKAAVKQPLLLMGYINPILAYGIEAFVADATAAGADGFIVPDLPPEEAHEMEAACARHGRALVFLLAPNSTDERIALATKRSSGFVYLVSVTGVTGARQKVSSELASFVARVRKHTNKPLAVGFGISTPHQAQIVAELADGVIVGSALINAVKDVPQPNQAAADMISRFAVAISEPLRTT